jgi:hypothetical protein
MGLRLILIVAAVVLLPLGQVGSAWGQTNVYDGMPELGRPVPREAVGDVIETRGPLTYGIADQVGHVLQAFAFAPFAAPDATVFAANGFGSRYCTTASCFFNAPLMLPNGALIEAIELEACDTNATAEISVALFRALSFEGGPNDVLALTSTGVAATPGCSNFTAILMAAHSVDNSGGTYVVQVDGFGGDDTTRFKAARVFYRLQMSPAPTSATFTDVPTGTPYHRAVEALAASGITSGCGGGNYCPDSSVTRGQMAVFLSKALGLHFPN